MRSETRPWRATLLLAFGCLSMLSACSLSFDAEWARRWIERPDNPPLPPLDDGAEMDLPVAEGLLARSGELRAIPLTWDPILDNAVGGYTIERSPQSEGPFRRIATVRGNANTAYVDRGLDAPLGNLGARGASPDPASDRAGQDLGDGARYFYRVRALAPSGAAAVLASSVIEATTAPAPDAPEGLRAYSGQPRRVPLSWLASAAPFVDGYVVSRSPTSRGDFEPLIELEGRFATVTVDSDLGDLRVFYYRVSARNAAGGLGKPSEPVRAVTKPEPLPPLDLRVAAKRLGSNHITWRANVEPDIRGYRVERSRGGAKLEVVADLPPEVTTCEDLEVAADERVSYTAIAYDDDGLESAAAAAVEVTSEGYALSVTLRSDGVHLAWNPRRDEDFVSARVIRGGRFNPTPIGVTREAAFVDRDVRPGGFYRYVVILERRDANVVPPSSPVEIRIPEEFEFGVSPGTRSGLATGSSFRSEPVPDRVRR